MNTNSHDPKCDDANCGCRTAPKKFSAAYPGGLARREFLKLLGLSGAGSLVGGSVFLTPRELMAADFSYSLIPANKNLDPAWIASLTARGTPTVVTAPAGLAHVGMPVGGICCGQLYLRGDGKLWYWDIFNAPTSAIRSKINTAGNYDSPYDSSTPPVSQGFALKVGGSSYFSLDATGFASVAFTGQYPIGVVNYSDPTCPIAVQLQAFSPFIPLDANNSGIPATVMEFTLTNTSGATVSAEIAGWLQNAVCAFTPGVVGTLLNHAIVTSDHTSIVSTLQAGTASTPVVFEDFESGTFLNAYTGQSWVTTGTAFGSGPVDTTNYPSSSYQILTGYHGRYVINSHASAPGSDAATRDAATGTLTSPTFTLNYSQISFLICGGNYPGQTCLNLCLASDNSVLMSATGSDSNTYTPQTWNVAAWVGQQVYFEIVDSATGGWGNIGVDYITFSNVRADLVFEDFGSGTFLNAYTGQSWVTTGTAFGSRPVDTTNYPSCGYQTLANFYGRYVVNSHASAPGGDPATRDAATGTLTSPSFTLSRHYLNFLICGGNYSGQTCMNLIVNNQIVCTAAGNDSNTYTQASWDVSAWEGQTAYLQIVDNSIGATGWGNIGIDYVVFSDSPPGVTPSGGGVAPTTAPDYGTMSLSLLAPQAGDQVSTNANISSVASLFTSLAANPSTDAQLPLGSQLMGALGRPLTLAPGASATVTFVLGWHFPKVDVLGSDASKIGSLKYYSTLFADASAVASYVAANYSMLGATTKLWRDTWYDSTLPYWFLDRTFSNTSTLATMTAYRFSTGRFYGPEGIYCCPGTCGHVWGYGQALGRMFPAIERYLRQDVDLNPNIAFNSSTGQINVRGEFGNPAVDGQAMVILRAYRDHQMSVDNTFLTTNYAHIKLATQYLISLDVDTNGILQGAQANTLDAAWYGKIPWLSSLYIAACKACQQMATEMGDTAFASQVGALAQAGATFIQNNLFYNSSYFVQIPDDSGRNVGANKGCEIDQVFGQSWAFQVGLGRVLDQTTTLTALAHLWTYNFAPDAGGFRTNPANPINGGRPFADVGEAGLVMGTFPDPANPLPSSGVVASYFNECMSGFEHEVASHMIWEGLLQDGLAITRAIHDRYAASKRNPYNEVECSDHYARAMASYGTFIAICGFEYHGPKGYIAFSPKLTPENFQAAFTSAAGWGSFNQQRTATQQTHTITPKQGQLTLNTLAFDLAPAGQSTGLLVTLNGSPVSASMSQRGVRVTVTLGSTVTIQTGQSLVVQINGTNLQDPAWVFILHQVVSVTNGIQLAWASVPGRTYTVQYASSLPAASWITLQTGVPASTGVSTTFADTTASGAAQRYYRVLLEPQ